jgi:hypothetical protein
MKIIVVSTVLTAWEDRYETKVGCESGIGPSCSLLCNVIMQPAI